VEVVRQNSVREYLNTAEISDLPDLPTQHLSCYLVEQELSVHRSTHAVIVRHALIRIYLYPPPSHIDTQAKDIVNVN
jgi:hypothetical protein